MPAPVVARPAADAAARPARARARGLRLQGLLAVALLLGSAGGDGVQAQPPASRGLKPTATVSGQVGLFLLNHRGEVDGLLLTDGTRIKFPPHLGGPVLSLFKPGEAVMVIGFAGLPTPFGSAVQALSLTHPATGRTVLDGPPAAYAESPRLRVKPEPLTATGSVTRVLVTPEGSVDGVILDSGIQVNVTARAGYLLVRGLEPPGPITVWGVGARTVRGTVLRARQIVLPSGEVLSEADRPEPKAKKGKRKSR